MRTSLRLATMAAAILLSATAVQAAAPPLADPASVGFDPERLDRLGAYMQGLVDRGERAGIVAIVARGGHIVHLGEYGMRDVANRKPMRANTLVRLYGMTEPVTAVAVMMLLEQGLLQLDDPIGNYLPELKSLQVLTKQPNGKYKQEPAKRPVTIRHLLTHTSGFAYEYPKAIQYKRDAVVGQGQTLATMVAQLAKLPLLHHPGDAATPGPGVNVLARLVEVVSKQPFDQFLEQRLFRPLHMLDTGFRVPAEKRDRFAEVYTKNAQGALTLATRRAPQAGPYDTQGKFLSGSEGLVSTALDFWSFAQMLANGGELDGVRILSPAAVQFMLRTHVSADAGALSPAALGGESLAGHGFGLGMVVLASPEKFGVLGSPGIARASGLANTQFWIDPERRIVAVLMTQHLGSSGVRLERDFITLVYQAVVD